MRQRRATIADDARPQHMPTKQSTFFGGEQPCCNGFVRHQFPATFVIKIANHRRHHAVLMKQQAHCIERFPDFLFECHEVTRFIVAIRDIDLHIFVVNFFAFDAKFAWIGMDDGDPMKL